MKFNFSRKNIIIAIIVIIIIVLAITLPLVLTNNSSSSPQIIVQQSQTPESEPSPTEPHSEVTKFKYYLSAAGQRDYLLTWEKPISPKANIFLYKVTIISDSKNFGMWSSISNTNETNLKIELDPYLDYTVNIKNLANVNAESIYSTNIPYPGTNFNITAIGPRPTKPEIIY